jgi:hypothetical protein
MNTKLSTEAAIFLLCVIATGSANAAEAAQAIGAPATAIAVSEPGAENGGLRLRLAVKPLSNSDKERADKEHVDKEGFDVRLELVNVSPEDITLQARWDRDEESSDVKDYLTAATSIETYPAIAPWIGGVQAGYRTRPQPELVLKAGETLPIGWKTTTWKLKNRVTDPNMVQNPEFPLPGLYSVHAKLIVELPSKKVLLRSNEALVSVGNSQELPKFTYGQLWGVDSAGKVGTLNLGSVNKIEIGDEFTHISKAGSWKLTVTDVQPEYSVGKLEPLVFPGGVVRNQPTAPARGDGATLTLKSK